MNNFNLWNNAYGNLNSNNKIVFLHGWGFHSDVWLPLIPFFEKDYHITFIDLPGHGRSVNVGWPDKNDDLIESLAEHISENTILVGWSLGGLLAATLAQQITPKIKALILIACNPCFVCRDDWRHAMPIATFNQFEEALQADGEQTLQQFVGLVCKDDEKSRTINKQLKAHLFEYGKPAWVALQTALSLLKTADIKNVLQQLKLPVLHVFGKQDALVPIDIVNNIRLLAPTHRISVIDKASHIPFYSQPQLVAEELIHFIEKVNI